MSGCEHLALLLLFCFGLCEVLAQSCEPSYFMASHKWHEISTDTLTGEVECTWTIKPKVKVRPQYYLEIEWSKFDVDSDMPECSNYFVEVKIKREKYTIGRLCSGNTKMVKPFNMYSSDGYATITFRINLKTSGGFALRYAIKKRKHYGCQQITEPMNPSVANIFAIGRAERAGQCKTVMLSSGFEETRISFMDFDFQYPESQCKSGITLKGSEVTFKEQDVLLPKSCGKRQPFSIISNYKRTDLNAEFNLRGETERGIIAGVIRYGRREVIRPRFAKLTFDHKSGIKPTLVVGEQKEPNMKFATGLAIGLIVGGIILFLIIPVAVFCCKGSSSSDKNSDYREMPRSPQSVREVRR